MNLNRRAALKQLLIITAGTAILPSCISQGKKASLPLKHLEIDATEEHLLAMISETIIPTTDTPGAKEVSAHLFVLKMVDDCYSPEDQKKFVAGLKDFEKMSEKKFGKSFVECAQAQREEILTDLQSRKDAADDLNFFYSACKSHTIQAYTSSKYFLTNVQLYELIPGRFHGCVPVDGAKKTVS